MSIEHALADGLVRTHPRPAPPLLSGYRPPARPSGFQCRGLATIDNHLDQFDPDDDHHYEVDQPPGGDGARTPGLTSNPGRDLRPGQFGRSFRASLVLLVQDVLPAVGT